MFEAQYLFAETTVLSPWMSRNGDNIMITVDLIKKNGSEIQVELYEKNSEDPGDGTAHSGGSLTTTGEGRDSKTYTGVKELVRFSITATTTTASNYALFRMLPNVWFDDVKPAGA